MSTTSPHTVIITGASSGMGLALARAFLARGSNVVGNARTAERLKQASRELGSPAKFVGIAGDIALPETAQHLFAEATARFGAVDVLVNNAGIFNPKPITQYSSAEIDALIDTNLRGFVYPAQQAAMHMSPRKRGSIINITASLAMQPNANVPASVPLLIKGGLNHATKALAIELAAHNVQVNAVAPGIIDTPLHSPESHEFLKSMQPAGHIGHVDDIVAAVLYLADAKFVTGVVLPVDGGMSAGKW